jgi:hypothetical protein
MLLLEAQKALSQPRCGAYWRGSLSSMVRSCCRLGRLPALCPFAPAVLHPSLSTQLAKAFT